MASYLVTGVSRGIGLAFLRQISSDPANTVIGVVRNKKATDDLVAKELKRDNIHILQGDLTDFESLKKAAEDTAKITGGSLDYLIANAAIISDWKTLDPLGVQGEDPAGLDKELASIFASNVIGNIHLINLFMPLILKGRVKKVIAISSGMADDALTAKYGVYQSAPYSMTKAALNTAIAKYSAQYAKDGVLFMSICPGMVDTGHMSDLSEEDQKKRQDMVQSFVAYAPHFSGPVTTEVAVKDVLSVVDTASVAKGYGGSFISHLGNKQWL